MGGSRPIRHVERSPPAGRLQGRERIGFGIAATAIVIYPFSTVLSLYSLNTGVIIVGLL
jgi:hypothetical protein